MKEYIGKTVFLIMVIVSNLSAHGEEKAMELAELAKTPFWADYQRALGQLREKYKLDESEFRERVLGCHFLEQVFLKSGLGDIGNGRYERVVQNDLKANNIAFEEKGKKERQWRGGEYRNPELVLLEGDQVVFSKRYGSERPSRDVTLVLFEPDRVEYFSWADFQGGWFKRRPQR